jgi:hypothetical protein
MRRHSGDFGIFLVRYSLIVCGGGDEWRRWSMTDRLYTKPHKSDTTSWDSRYNLNNTNEYVW